MKTKLMADKDSEHRKRLLDSKMEPTALSDARMISATSYFIVGLTSLVLILGSSEAFQLLPKRVRMTQILRHTTTLSSHVDRRNFLIGTASSSLLFGPVIGNADDDLTSQMFNPDGSLKQGDVEVAKTKLVAFDWDQSDNMMVNIDGKNTEGTSSGNKIRISYELPAKWGRGSDIYIDTSEGVNAPACKRITVYKAPGKASADRLEKATTIGVGKALQVTDDLGKLATADIIGGRKRTLSSNNGEKYFDFDLASAPQKCDQSASKDDLGLGFCPYDTVFLISATILDESLYVMAIECDNLEWKQGNADLKRVRSSFSVETIA